MVLKHSIVCVTREHLITYWAYLGEMKIDMFLKPFLWKLLHVNNQVTNWTFLELFYFVWKTRFADFIHVLSWHEICKRWIIVQGPNNRFHNWVSNMLKTKKYRLHMHVYYLKLVYNIITLNISLMRPKTPTLWINVLKEALWWLLEGVEFNRWERNL